MEDHRQSSSQAEHSERHVLLKKKVKNCTKGYLQTHTTSTDEATYNTHFADTHF
jgi:hypothetical protein